MQHKALIITQDENLHQEISNSLQDASLTAHHASTHLPRCLGYAHTLSVRHCHYGF